MIIIYSCIYIINCFSDMNPGCPQTERGIRMTWFKTSHEYFGHVALNCFFRNVSTHTHNKRPHNTILGLFELIPKLPPHIATGVVPVHYIRLLRSRNLRCFQQNKWGACYTWMSRWKLGSMVRISGLFHLPINGIDWGYNPFTNHLLTSIGTSK